MIRHLKSFSTQDISRLIHFAKHDDYHIYLQPNKIDSIHRIYPETGSDLLHYRLEDYDLEIQFHPSDFTQINPAINRKMINLAIELLQLQAHDHALDLFCGLGNFTLPIAKNCHHVLGVEGDQTMVKRAQQNATHNQVFNAEFLCADLFNLKPFSSQQFSKILLDPPRTGAMEITQQLDQFNAERIVYVSCNPATLARDAGEIVNSHGYQLSAVGVIDQFPHTCHVEAIALFERDTHG